MIKDRSLLVVAAVAALLLVGCGDKGGTEAQTSPPAKPPRTIQTVASAKGLKLVYIPKNTGNPYFNAEIEGFKEACAKEGLDFFTTGPATAEPTAQIPILKEQIQRGVDIIAVTPDSEDAVNAVLEQAMQKGIVVLCVDADVKPASFRDACVLPTDPSKVGESQVEALGSLINYEGPIAILSATAEAPNQKRWVEGMNDVLKNNPKYARMKLVETVFGNDEPQKSTTEFEGLVSKHADLAGVISPTSVGLPAAAQSLAISGNYKGGPKANGKGIAVVGLSTPNQMKKYVADGVVQKFQLWNPKDMGVIATYLAIGIKTGKIKPTVGGMFDVPGFPGRKFEQDNVVYAGPLITFDKTNIDKFNF